MPAWETLGLVADRTDGVEMENFHAPSAESYVDGESVQFIALRSISDPGTIVPYN